MNPELATDIIAGATVASHVVFVLFLFLYVTHTGFKEGTQKVVKNYIDEIIFLFSLVSLLGSLVYSNIVGFPPCDLCWIQRIFMYPQTLIAAVSIWRKEKLAVYYTFPLSILGGAVALFQSLTNWGIGGSLLPCTASGGACSKVYVLEYGYITIPVMALTAFVYLLTASWIYRRSQ